MSSCCVKGCVNTSKNRHSANICFYRFPTEKTRQIEWIDAAKLKNNCEVKYKRICSEHFTANDIWMTPMGQPRLRPKAVPTVFLHEDRENVQPWMGKSVVLRRDAVVPVNAGSASAPDVGTSVTSEHCMGDRASSILFRLLTGTTETSGALVDKQPLAQRQEENSTPLTLLNTTKRLVVTVRRPSSVNLNSNQPSPDECDLNSNQPSPDESDLNSNQPSPDKSDLNSNQPLQVVACFGAERFAGDDKTFKFFTGFQSYKQFVTVYNAIEPHAALMIKYKQIHRLKTNKTNKISAAHSAACKPTLSLLDQFFLFLHKIRLGSLDADLADKFSISVSTVSRIIITWANFLYIILGSQPIWPSKAKVLQHMSADFKEYFPQTRVILDCTEIYTQTPSSLVLKSEVFSHYKSRPTFKSLIGITPAGAVSFVSSLYSGCASDKHIVSDSGLLSLLEPGDAVLVDKGILINDLLEPIGCTLIIPPFLSNKSQFSEGDVKLMNEIARLRVHVERAIRRVKENHIFDSAIPLNLTGTINQIWTVACLLTNFRGPLY